MDNQDSSAALTFPNVPDDFCPSGNWQNVFQSFIDEVLANGTINVPGLGDVTPEQIAALTQQVVILTDQVTDLSGDVAALTTTVSNIPVVNVRQGTIGSLIAGDSVLTVTFAAMPNSNYGVSITPICNSSIAAQPTPLFALVTGSKTATGFSIRIENNIAEITSVDWMAVHTS
jgi:hypothetical protein